MSPTQELKIVQWNCHSLSNKLSNFKLNIYTSKPHVVCLSETWLSPNYEPNVINYNAIYKHRGAPQPGGGLAVFVRSDITYLEQVLQPFPQGFLEVCAIKIYLKNNVPFSILNVYNPNENVSPQEFNHYFHQLEPSCLIVGDFNAHSPIWEPGKTSNHSGRSLENILLNNATLSLLTPPSLPTFFSTYHNSFSTLDLSIISTNLLPLASVSTESDMGSDHYSVITCVGIEAPTVHYRARPSWRFERGSWGAWAVALQQRGITPSHNFEASCEDFANSIVSSSAEVFSQTKEIVNPRYNKPWWTCECAQAVEARRAAKRALISKPSPATLVAFKRCSAKVKWEVKKAKQESWRDYCSRITSDTPISQLWNHVKRLRTPFVRKSQPFIVPNAVITDSYSKAQALSLHYEQLLTCPTPSPYPRHVILPLAVALHNDTHSPINEPFSLHELEGSVICLKKTSPGLDRVHNSHLMHLPLDHKKWLLDLFNQSLHSAIVPKSWKVALIVPIPKPAKCLTSVSSYRPISLLSCISKLLEALINKRLGFFLEKNDSLRPSQGGFRRRLAGVDQIARLEAAIRTALTNRSPLVAVFCDLSNAFDRVWHTGLLYKLSQCGVHGALLRWLRAYLADRSFCVQFEGQTSSSRKIKSGVPQGAILSPLLFNVMMRDLPSVLGVHTADYADDVAFFSYGPDLGITTDKIQTQLNKFFEWTKMWGLSINHLKTKCMLFTNKKVTAIPLSINGSNLEYVKQHRYLGVILDAPWLRWEPQISSLKLSCIPITNLLQSISSRHWGADRALLLKLYRVLIRSRLDYAAAFYASAAPTNLRKLNVIQNNCLRIALGCRRTTPVPSMEVEAHIPPLSVHRNELLCKYYFRLIQLPHCPIVTELFHQNVPPCLPNRALCQPISFISHARAIMSTLQIPVPHMLASPLVSPLPPWFNVDEYFLDQFSSATVSVTSSEAAVQIFSDMTNSKFLTHAAIYTDGSQIKT